MADSIGKAGQCSAEYAQRIEDLSFTLGVDLPDCAKLDRIGAGESEGVIAQNVLSNGQKHMVSFFSDGRCFGEFLLPVGDGKYIQGPIHTCEAAPGMFSIDTKKAAEAIEKAREIRASLDDR